MKHQHRHSTRVSDRSSISSLTLTLRSVNRPFPRTIGQLCQYLADGVSVTRLFPHDRVGKDGRRCRATHIRKGDTWVVIPQCNEPCKSVDNYARHVKTVHLRGFECVGGVRGSVSIVDWLNSKSQNPHRRPYTHLLQMSLGFAYQKSRLIWPLK
jgi:hypothetical protein